MLDLELLRHNNCVPVEGATRMRELAAAARVRAYHEHGLCWHHRDLPGRSDERSSHVLRDLSPRPRSTSSASQPTGRPAMIIWNA